MSLPENSYGSIRDKTSLAAKEVLTLGGVIDNDYTGEIIVTMTSLIERTNKSLKRTKNTSINSF